MLPRHSVSPVQRRLALFIGLSVLWKVAAIAAVLLVLYAAGWL